MKKAKVFFTKAIGCWLLNFFFEINSQQTLGMRSLSLSKRRLCLRQA